MVWEMFCQEGFPFLWNRCTIVLYFKGATNIVENRSALKYTLTDQELEIDLLALPCIISYMSVISPMSGNKLVFNQSENKTIVTWLQVRFPALGAD